MNFSSFVVLGVIALLLGLAVRYMARDQKRGKCAGCAQESCSMGAGGDGSSCPSVRQAFDAVEERLGPVE